MLEADILRACVYFPFLFFHGWALLSVASTVIGLFYSFESSDLQLWCLF